VLVIVSVVVEIVVLVEVVDIVVDVFVDDDEVVVSVQVPLVVIGHQ